MPSYQSYDFYNPFMAAAIVDKNGERFPLWTNKGGNPFNIASAGMGPLRALAFLSEIQIELQLGDIPRITATLTPPYEDAIRLMDSELVEFGNARLEVMFGYASGTSTGEAVLSPIFEGLLIKPDISIGIDSTFILHAQGTGGYAAVSQVSYATFKEKTRRSIISDVLARHGLQIDDTHIDSASDSFKLWDGDKITVAQGNKTDWFFITTLSNEARVWIIYTEKGKVRFVPRNKNLNGQPTYQLSMFELNQGMIGGEVFPILSAQTSSAAIYLPGLRGLLLKGVDAKSKKSVQQIVDDKLVRTNRTDKGAADVKGSTSFADPNDKSGFNAFPGDPSSDVAKAQAVAAFDNFGPAMGIPMDVETLGIPDMSPGDVVQINGMGLRLNGNYGVFKLTHTLSNSGYTSNLKLVSNTAKILAMANQVTPSGQTNTKVAPDVPSNAVDAQPKPG